MRPITQGSQLKKGTMLSYLNILANALSTLILTFFMTRALGDSEYGLYTLIGAMAAYFAVFDFGLGNAIIRYVAKYQTEHDTVGESNFLALCMGIYALIAMVVAVAGFFLARHVDAFFNLTPAQIPRAQTMAQILIVNLILTLFVNAFTGILSGREHFVFPRVCTVVRIVVRVAAVFVLLNAGHDSVSIVIIDTVLTVLTLLLLIWYTLIRLRVPIRLSNIDFPLLKEVFSFSFYIFVAMLVDLLYWQTGSLLLGARKHTAAVTPYGQVSQLRSMYMLLSTAISGVFLPKITRMEVQKAPPQAFTDILIKTGRLQFIILGLLLAGFVGAGKPFTLLWVGDTSGVVYQISLLFMLALTVPLIQTIGISILQAKNKHRFRALSYLLITAVCVTMGALLVDSLGIWGVALATIVSLVLGNTILMNIYYHRMIKLDIPRFFKEVSRGIVPSLLLAAGTGVLLALIPALQTLPLLSFVTAGAGDAIVYTACLALFGLNGEERALVRLYLKNFTRRG